MLWQTTSKPRGVPRLPSGFIVPCQPVPARRVPIGPEWIHEFKFDGQRIIGRKAGDRLQLWDPSGNEVTAQFASIATALRAIPHDFVIDGEAHCEQPAGGPVLRALRSFAGRSCAVLMAFDLLFLDGEHMLGVACEERRARLKTILPGEGGVLRFSESVEGPDGELLLEEARRHKFEGIVSKRKASRYRSGPFGDWREIKCSTYRPSSSHDAPAGSDVRR